MHQQYGNLDTGENSGSELFCEFNETMLAEQATFILQAGNLSHVPINGRHFLKLSFYRQTVTENFIERVCKCPQISHYCEKAA